MLSYVNMFLLVLNLDLILTLLLFLLKLCERKPVVFWMCFFLWVGVKLLSGLPDSRFDNIDSFYLGHYVYI